MKKWKSCKFCNKFFTGRSDKLYCDDHCRSGFHNLDLREERLTLHPYNKRLRRNRRILKVAWERGIRTISIRELVRRYFDLEYFTRLEKTLDGRTTYHCYEFVYRIDRERGLVFILRREDPFEG